jgi:DNA repair exonuclease SbcCD ATPase subunit
MSSEKITVNRLNVEDLQDEFHDVLSKIVEKANDAIESAESELNDASEELKTRNDEYKILERENLDLESELDKLRAVKKQIIDFDAIERMVNFAPGDPGHMYPLHERIEKVLARANTERNNARTELQSLKDAIIPELERLEGHENRLRVIVGEFAGKVKGERLATLLREAQAAFNQA